MPMYKVHQIFKHKMLHLLAKYKSCLAVIYFVYFLRYLLESFSSFFAEVINSFPISKAFIVYKAVRFFEAFLQIISLATAIILCTPTRDLLPWVLHSHSAIGDNSMLKKMS